MIEVNDIVRLKNEAIAAKESFACCGRTRWKRGYKRFRGKQKIARVLRIVDDSWDWRSRRHNRIVELDIPSGFGRFNKQMSTQWLAVVKKGRKVA